MELVEVDKKVPNTGRSLRETALRDAVLAAQKLASAGPYAEGLRLFEEGFRDARAARDAGGADGGERIKDWEAACDRFAEDVMSEELRDL